MHKNRTQKLVNLASMRDIRALHDITAREGINETERRAIQKELRAGNNKDATR